MDTIFQINFFRQVHLGGDNLEDKTLLSTVWKGKLNLSIQTSWTEERGVKCILAIRGHNNLYEISFVL